MQESSDEFMLSQGGRRTADDRLVAGLTATVCVSLPGKGRGVSPLLMGYTGMCGPKDFGFSAVLHGHK